MALAAQIVVESRRYSGWIDPRYPIGYWQAALTLTGNATGGVLAIDLVFQGALAGFLNSQMYSVERMGATVSAGNTRVAQISAVNMSGPANQGFEHEYSVVMTPQAGVSRSAIEGNQLTILPWFLGSQRIAGTTASLSFLQANDDGVVYTFEAEGYRWSARSVLVDGGPQRPPTGLYRA